MDADFTRIFLVALILFFALLDWLSRSMRERREEQRRAERSETVVEEEVPPEWWDTGLPSEEVPERVSDEYDAEWRLEEVWTTVSSREEPPARAEPQPPPAPAPTPRYEPPRLPVAAPTTTSAPPVPSAYAGDLTESVAPRSPLSPAAPGTRRRRWIRNAGDARRGMVMMLILGRPRGLDH